jgi:hypothetical protein
MALSTSIITVISGITPIITYMVRDDPVEDTQFCALPAPNGSKCKELWAGRHQNDWKPWEKILEFLLLQRMVETKRKMRRFVWIPLTMFGLGFGLVVGFIGNQIGSAEVESSGFRVLMPIAGFFGVVDWGFSEILKRRKRRVEKL